MLRYLVCLGVALFAGASLRAGELDADFKPAAPATPAVHQDAFVPVNPLGRAALGLNDHDATTKASELDDESPAQSWGRWRGCGWGCGWRGCAWRGCGWGGCGWRGCGWGGCGWGGWGCGWGCYRPCFAFAPVSFSIGFGGCYPYGGFCW